MTATSAGAGPPSTAPDDPQSARSRDMAEEPVAGDWTGQSSATDIVEIWGLGSFPASDPPSNW
jgi:hypothetical protein